MERQLELNKWWLLCKRIRAQTGAKKEPITEKDTSKSSYGVCEKHLNETADMWRNGL